MALVQTVTSNSSAAAPTVALTGVVSGNTIILFITKSISTTTISSITDSSGNTVSLANSGTGSAYGLTAIYYVANASAGAHTFTINYNSGNTNVGYIWVREYSGLLTTSPYDVSTNTVGSTSSTTSTIGPTATTTSANELIVAVVADSTDSLTYTVGSGYGNLAQDHTNFHFSTAIEDKTVSATGTQTATWTKSSATSSYGGTIATFKTVTIVTKTQTAIARIAKTVTKTQASIARIAKTVTRTQTSVTRIANNKTKTQPSVGRISNSKTKTQNAISRVANNRILTQSATANIQNSAVRSLTQPSVARIIQSQIYSYGTYSSLPTGVALLTNIYTPTQIANVSTVDGVFVNEITSLAYGIHQFGYYVAGGPTTISPSWTGSIGRPASAGAVTFQIYNFSTTSWETMSTNTSAAGGATITLTGTKSGSNYFDSNNFFWTRVYQ